MSIKSSQGERAHKNSPVNGSARNRLGKTGSKHRHPSKVARLGANLRDTSEDDIVDNRRLAFVLGVLGLDADTSALDGLFDDGASKVRGLPLGETAVLIPRWHR